MLRHCCAQLEWRRTCTVVKLAYFFTRSLGLQTRGTTFAAPVLISAVLAAKGAAFLCSRKAMIAAVPWWLRKLAGECVRLRRSLQKRLELR
jgi:hypothetical protein